MSEREQPSDGPYAPAQQHFLCARVVWRAQVTALPFKSESVSNLLTEVCLWGLGTGRGGNSPQREARIRRLKLGFSAQ